jgi:hypothetical protein
MNFDGWKGIKKLIHYTKEKQTVIYKPEMEEKSIEGKTRKNWNQVVHELTPIWNNYRKILHQKNNPRR